MEKILIVEDDDGISDFVKLELEHEGFQTLIAKDGREALDFFENFSPDLILLDVMLPKLSGLEVLRRIRKSSKIPVIMVTARGETYDRVNGLDAGADDYLPKPFEIEELLARMRAVFRRSKFSEEEAKIYKIQEIELNTESMKVTVGKNTIDLSKTEFLMLKLLMENKNKVLSRDKIIDEIWGTEHFIDINTVDVYIGYLRAKIDQVLKKTYIKTVRGSGYMMIDEE